MRSIGKEAAAEKASDKDGEPLSASSNSQRRFALRYLPRSLCLDFGWRKALIIPDASCARKTSCPAAYLAPGERGRIPRSGRT